MDKVLVVFETEPYFRKELEGIFSGCKIIFNENNNTDAIDAETAGNITVILGNVKPGFLKLCPRLKWLQLNSAGTNGYMEGQVKEPVLFTCASGAYGLAVSEHMVALSFELMKKLHLYRDEQAKGRWQDRGPVKSVQGAVVLVIGMGDIGRNYAWRMKALGSYVIGIDINAYKKPDFLDELHLSQKMDELLPRADVVALIVPGTKDTVGLIGRAQLAKMKKDAVIINACRGAVLDTEAVCDALESGALGGAGLEVTEPEPLPPGHRLWKLENAVITPHISGGRHLPATFRSIMDLCLENSRRFIKGEKLKSLVDFRTGFRIPEA
jgi:phosphoglycerate dehydrogenase-like enzyme